MRMRKFPVKEADIYQLASVMYFGLRKPPAVFAAPPVPWARLNLKRMLYQQRCRYATRYQAALAAGR